MSRCISSFLLLCISVTSAAQETNVNLVQDMPWRNIGPSNMMGRIAVIYTMMISQIKPR